jgi:hypothetical protein
LELQASRAAALLAASLLCLSVSPAASAARDRARPADKKPSLRPEDDPALAGDAPAFSKAQVAFRAPADGAELPPGEVLVQLELQGYALGPAPLAVPRDPDRPIPARDPVDAATASAPDAATPSAPDTATPSAPDAATPSAPDAASRASAADGPAPTGRAAPFAILLVDNDGALRIDDAAPARLLRGLAPGPHLLRVVLSRPWGEVVKSSGAFALTRFWLGPRPPDASAAREQEAKSWPDLHRALLTYVFPLGELRRDLSLRAAGPEPSEAAPAPPLPTPRALDFFLSLARLQEQGRGDKVRVVLNKRELPTQRAWHPLPLPLQPGRNRVTIDLLDRRSTKVKNAVNRTDRVVLVE